MRGLGGSRDTPIRDAIYYHNQHDSFEVADDPRKDTPLVPFGRFAGLQCMKRGRGVVGEVGVYSHANGKGKGKMLGSTATQIERPTNRLYRRMLAQLRLVN